MDYRIGRGAVDFIAPLRGRAAVGLGVTVAAFGLLAACAPEVVKVPVEVPVKVPVEVPVALASAKCELPQINEGRKFVAEAWGVPDSTFDIGEPLRLQMRVSSASFVNVYHVSTSCKVTRLLNNRRVAATKIVDFPLRGSGIRMTVKPPEGKEAFYVIATREKLKFLAPGDILRESGDIASLDLTAAQFHERLSATRGRINPDDWSIKTLQTSVVGR